MGTELAIACSRFVRSSARRAAGDTLSVTWRIVSLIDAEGPLRPSEIARYERTSRPTTTAVVQRLEADGLITRTADPKDCRSVLVQLTPEGHERLASWRQAVAECLDPLLTDLQPDGLDILRRATPLLEVLATRLEGLTD